ncbi:UbiA family prenyltransferase [Larkinella sp. VNQ87]|uniref:UbiA family prenyltransferase n=1 Tax=Larkinella sp. VNQ87 TaxID=3400921 RepID=UPI003C0D9301
MENPLLRTSQEAVHVTRAGEWWGYKFSPLLATLYATAGVLETALWPLAPRLLLLLLSLTVGAIYVSILNDWTDREDDRIAGKTNRLMNKSARFVAIILTTCLSIGLGFGIYFWSLNPVISLFYLGSWMAYSMYSLPPFRLKIRGLGGVLADALGAHLFPQLLVVALVEHWAGQPLPPIWWLAIGSWALACGIRNILKHQLGDATADRQAGVRTLVTLQGERWAHRFGVGVMFPIECLGFAVLLILLGQVAPVVFLLLYSALETMRARLWGIRPAVLDPNQRIVLDEYYTIFFPLALLLTQAIRNPADAIILGLHLLLFGRHSLETAHEFQRLVIKAVRRLLGLPELTDLPK